MPKNKPKLKSHVRALSTYNKSHSIQDEPTDIYAYFLYAVPTIYSDIDFSATRNEIKSNELHL